MRSRLLLSGFSTRLAPCRRPKTATHLGGVQRRLLRSGVGYGSCGCSRGGCGSLLLLLLLLLLVMVIGEGEIKPVEELSRGGANTQAPTAPSAASKPALQAAAHYRGAASAAHGRPVLRGRRHHPVAAPPSLRGLLAEATVRPGCPPPGASSGLHRPVRHRATRPLRATRLLTQGPTHPR